MEVKRLRMCANAVKTTFEIKRRLRGMEVRTRVLWFVDLIETCTYLRITGSPFCCCDMLTVRTAL